MKMIVITAVADLLLHTEVKISLIIWSDVRLQNCY